MFIEHIPFFSITTSFNNMIKFDLIHIDPFPVDTEIVLPFVLHRSIPISDHDFCKVPVDSSAYTGTLANNTSVIPSPSTTARSPTKTVSPLHCYPTRTHNSTQLPDFVYSYSSSFFLFQLLFIVFLSFCPMERQFVTYFGRRLWLRNLLIYTRHTLGTCIFIFRKRAICSH